MFLVIKHTKKRKERKTTSNDYHSWSKVGAAINVVPKGCLNSGFLLLRDFSFFLKFPTSTEEVLMRNQLEMVANFLWYNFEFPWMNGLQESGEASSALVNDCTSKCKKISSTRWIRFHSKRESMMFLSLRDIVFD